MTTWTAEQAQAYANANPDVMAAFKAGQLNQGDTNLASAMAAHYDWAGQKEGRAAPTVQPAAQPPAGSNTTGWDYNMTPLGSTAPGVNNSPQVAAAFQANAAKNAYDINGNPITLQDGYKLGGGLFGNAIFNDKGQGVGQYYTSPEDAAYWKSRTQQAMDGTAVIGGGITLDQQRQNLQNTLNTGGINPGVTGGATGGYDPKQWKTYTRNGGPGMSGWSGPARETNGGGGALNQIQQWLQSMLGGQQGGSIYNPNQQYSPYGSSGSQGGGYNPFGSMYGMYNPFGNQYSNYQQPTQQQQPAYQPSNNVSGGQTSQNGQPGSFSPGYMNYNMGFRQGQMPNFGPLSQLQANAMYA